MKLNNKAKIILSLILVVVIFSVISLIYWDFIRDAVVMPVYYVIWLGDLLLKSIPQEVYLVILIGLCIVMGVTTVAKIRTQRLAESGERQRPIGGTRYLFWRKIYSHIDSSQFARNHFASETRRLILAILSHQEGVDVFEVERMIVNGDLPVPKTVRNLILKQEIKSPIKPQKAIEGVIDRLRNLILGEDSELDLQIDPQTDEIVSFIEQRLEITRDGN